MTGFKVENIVEVLVQSTLKTIQTQFSIDAQKECLMMKDKPVFETNLFATIPLVCSCWTGELSVGFPEETYLKLLEKMLGQKFEHISAETQDAAAEILNIIYGTSKAIWNKEGCDFGLAIPVVTKGNLSHNKDSNPTLMVIFKTSVGDFLLKLKVNSISKKAS
jgi:CheY-specific phosphatase CheX